VVFEQKQKKICFRVVFYFFDPDRSGRPCQVVLRKLTYTTLTGCEATDRVGTFSRREIISVEKCSPPYQTTNFTNYYCFIDGIGTAPSTTAVRVKTTDRSALRTGVRVAPVPLSGICNAARNTRGCVKSGTSSFSIGSASCGMFHFEAPFLPYF
jgi:hypothetical protein